MLNIRTKILVCGYLVQGADFWRSYVYNFLNHFVVKNVLIDHKGIGWLHLQLIISLKLDDDVAQPHCNCFTN